MYLHANAKLGLAGRLALVRAIKEGLTLKAAAAAWVVSAVKAEAAVSANTSVLRYRHDAAACNWPDPFGDRAGRPRAPDHEHSLAGENELD
jgi:hypothetical protein